MTDIRTQTPKCRSVCVFCGSSSGPEAFRSMAEDLGLLLAREQIDLVYGGGNIGLMGILADSALAHAGKVIGVIPQFLIDLEVAHHGLSELVIVSSMHERKAEMAARADLFVALPGGFGTLEEFFEVLTWLQLGLHRKRCVLLNFEDFYTPLISFLHSAHDAGYISADSLSLVTVCTSLEELLALIRSTYTDPDFLEGLT